MKRAAFIIFIGILVISLSSWAAEKFPQGNFSELKQMQDAQVSAVIDPLTLQLDDKRTIQLEGIEFPDFNPNQPGQYSITAIGILKDMLESKTVNIYQTKKDNWGRVNRMGHELAHVARKTDNAWVQGSLLALGLARVMTDQRNPEKADQMYAVERAARAEKIGIWGDPAYKIITPEEAAKYKGSVQIVEGRIRSAAIRQNRIYLNFGDDWRTDFTVSITSENRREFSKQNVDPLQWDGKNARVRGWIGDYNGPFIEIDHPQRIELLDEGDSSGALPLKDASPKPMLNSMTIKN